MGALHGGHLSLIEQASANGGITVCSIFVNPTQFNDLSDYNKYPITLEKDIQLLSRAKTDILFLPDVNEVYPKGTQQVNRYNLGYLETILEGSFRPGHFQGVCQVVDRLLQIVRPHLLYLGKKDYQQCMVLKKMMSEAHPNCEVRLGNTLREESGLAMSSRNSRLEARQREQAAAIYKMLLYINKQIHQEPIGKLKAEVLRQLHESGFEKVDYVEVCDADTLLPVADEGKKNTKLIALVAAYIGGVRLIDNLYLS